MSEGSFQALPAQALEALRLSPIISRIKSMVVNAHSSSVVRIRRMTIGQFWLLTAAFALTCVPFIQRSATGYDRLVSQQDDLIRTLVQGVSAHVVTPQQIIQVSDENRQALGQERAIGFMCKATAVIIAAAWGSIAWVWFGRRKADGAAFSP